jgi:hypothetical protein
MSEHAAYARIEAARLARRIPGILDRLADGRLSLTSIGLLAPHLDGDYCEELLDAATHLSKREVERLIAALHPQPEIPASVRALPVNAANLAVASEQTPSASSESLAPAITLANQTAGATAAASRPLTVTACRSVPVVAPLGPRQYLLRVTIGEDTQRKLERARDLLRHEVPDGDLAAIIDRGLTLLVSKAERTKFAAARAKPRTRVATPVATATRVAVASSATPVGAARPVENLELRCRPHNGYEAERAGLTHWHG